MGVEQRVGDIMIPIEIESVIHDIELLLLKLPRLERQMLMERVFEVRRLYDDGLDSDITYHPV